MKKRNAILVLMMHRVLSDREKAESNSEDSMIVDRQTYHDMITHILRHYRIVDLAKREVDFAGPKLGIGLTFDDGWNDNYEVVLRDHRERGVPATIFISPALTGQDNPFWPERVRELLQGRPEQELKTVVESLKKLQPAERNARINEIAQQAGRDVQKPAMVDYTMDWQRIHELRREGITFGSHTQNHEILTSLPNTAMMDRELGESKRDIERELGESCEILAYPNGGHSDLVVERSWEMGYRRAFTVQTGAWTPETHPLRIPRLNISDGRVSFGSGFSAPAFEFAVVWRSYRALRRANAAKRQMSAAAVPAAAIAAAAVRERG